MRSPVRQTRMLTGASESLRRLLVNTDECAAVQYHGTQHRCGWRQRRESSASWLAWNRPSGLSTGRHGGGSTIAGCHRYQRRSGGFQCAALSTPVSPPPAYFYFIAGCVCVGSSDVAVEVVFLLCSHSGRSQCRHASVLHGRHQRALFCSRSVCRSVHSTPRTDAKPQMWRNPSLYAR